MRCAIRLNYAETDSSQLITYGLARYIDNVIYHRSYKQWRIHSPKIKSHFKYKSSKNHSMIKSPQKSTSHISSSTILTSTSYDIGNETKLVKFDNESLPTKQTLHPCKTLPSECTVPRSYKKQRAPQPPVTTTTSTTTTTTTTTVITTNTTTTTTAVMVTTKNSLKVNSDQIIYTSSPILKSTSNSTQSKLNSLSLKQNDHRKFYSPICNTCGLCFNNLSIIDRKIKTRSTQPLVTTSTITEISPPPPPLSSSSSPPPPPPTTTTTPTELTTGAILFNPKNNSSKR
ncbi:innexin [Schistosoma bovis]|uniref:Innexin n=1 Tax=Schistosoma bovis TaxID=6184 RepID=A0A430PXV3_SCHBO|nr:innexin [Schistosoma bovis]